MNCIDVVAEAILQLVRQGSPLAGHRIGSSIACHDELQTTGRPVVIRLGGWAIYVAQEEAAPPVSEQSASQQQTLTRETPMSTTTAAPGGKRRKTM